MLENAEQCWEMQENAVNAGKMLENAGTKSEFSKKSRSEQHLCTVFPRLLG